MKFIQTKPASHFCGDWEITNNRELPNDDTGWSLWLNGEWLADASTKKALIKKAETMENQGDQK